MKYIFPINVDFVKARYKPTWGSSEQRVCTGVAEIGVRPFDRPSRSRLPATTRLTSRQFRFDPLRDFVFVVVLSFHLQRPSKRLVISWVRLLLLLLQLLLLQRPRQCVVEQKVRSAWWGRGRVVGGPGDLVVPVDVDIVLKVALASAVQQVDVGVYLWL